MVWSGISISASMNLPTNQVTISNLGGEVIDYIEQNGIEIEGNDVRLQILLIDKYNKVTLVDEMLFQIEIIIADYLRACTIQLGVNYSLNDPIPRGTIETNEFPAIRGDAVRIGT